jgi:hypothetical protein
MNKKNEQEEISDSQKLFAEINNVIIEYCFKSDRTVSGTQIIHALATTLAAHMTTMTKDWTEAEEKKAVQLLFEHVEDAMKEFKKELEEEADGIN